MLFHPHTASAHHRRSTVLSQDRITFPLPGKTPASQTLITQFAGAVYELNALHDNKCFFPETLSSRDEREIVRFHPMAAPATPKLFKCRWKRGNKQKKNKENCETRRKSLIRNERARDRKYEGGEERILQNALFIQNPMQVNHNFPNLYEDSSALTFLAMLHRNRREIKRQR